MKNQANESHRSNGRGLPEARALYVSGQAGSLAEAARKVGGRYETIRLAARREGWRRQRAEYQEQVHRRALERSGTREAAALAGTRSAVVEALALGAAQILARLRSVEEDRLLIRASDVEKLAKTYLALADRREDPAPTTETLLEGYVEIRRTLVEEFGTEQLTALDTELDR